MTFDPSAPDGRARIYDIPGRLARWLLVMLLACVGSLSQAQQDPPGRVARLGYQQGSVSFSPAGDDSWYELPPNRPLTAGDRLWTDRGSRAEIGIGSATLRLDEQSAVTLAELDDDSARIVADQGRIAMRVRQVGGGQRFELDTPNAALVADAPGDFRVEAEPGGGTTRVAVQAGRATLFGEAGQSLALGAGQQLTVAGRDLATVAGPVRASSSFDAFVAERNRIEDQSLSARYVSREVVGYQQLDAYGDWRSEPDFGPVWYPREVDADWAPYRDGQWVDIAPWGWTWIDAAPWGFAPSHYGRWARIGPRWGWVPGRADTQPVYLPAVVGFVGGAGAPLPIAGGRNAVGWFPLAPGERWQPGYRASARYIDEANRAAAYPRTMVPRNAADYAHRQTPGAITLVPVDVFGRGPMQRRDLVRLPPERFAGAQIGGMAPVPLRNEREPWRGGRPHAAPPASAFGQAGAWPYGMPPQGRGGLPFQQQELLQRQQRQMQPQMQQQAAQQQWQQQQQQQIQQQQLQQQLGRQQQEAALRAQQAQQAQMLQQQAAQQQMQLQVQRNAQAAQAAQALQAQQAAQAQQALQMQQAQQAQQALQAQRAMQAQQAQQAMQAQQALHMQQQAQAQAQAQAQQQMQLQAQQQMQAQALQQQMRAQQALQVQQQQQRALQMQQQRPLGRGAQEAGSADRP